MTPKFFARLPGGERIVATARWTTDRLELTAGPHRVAVDRVRAENGESDAHQTLGLAAAELAEHGVELIACASCQRFQFSGMSRQMSAGRLGYCHLAGFRRRDAAVRVDWVCGEHQPLEGWNTEAPWSLEAIDARRGAAAEGGRLAAFRGAIFGLAIGDALGFPTEFRSRDQIVAAFGPAGVTDFVAAADPRWGDQRGALIDHPPGTYSDDTQMSLAVAEALIEAGDAELDALMQRMAERFIDWSCSDENDRAPGSTCMTACSNLAAGTPWREAGVDWSKGAGAPMRAVPIGLRYWRERERMLEVARASSIITHGHPSAVESTAAVALMVAMALDKQPPETIWEALVDECGDRAPELAARLARVPELLDAPAAIALSADGLGEAWIAEEAVATALWCVWQSPADFDATVLAAANATGDSDTIATIAGGVSGALNGAAAIRGDWIERVEKRDVLEATADRLWRARSS